MVSIVCIVVIIIIFLVASGYNNHNRIIEKTTVRTVNTTTYNSFNNYNESREYTKNYSYFSNKYGNASTRCAHPGCSNYIASSGDTNCCVVHSKRCRECGCYIDEDAMYCMDCLENEFY